MSVVEVAAGLVFRDGKLLITKRYDDAHLGGFWEFPGGKREPNETFEGCLVRELREELAIEIKVGELVEDITHAYPEKTVHLRFFHCAWLEKEPSALGCAAFEWITREQLRDFEFPAADSRLLRLLEAEPLYWISGA